MRRTQPRCLTRRAGDDGDAHRAGAAGGAAATPASFCRRFKAREHPQATRTASSPLREPLELLHGEEEAATDIIDGRRRPRVWRSGGGARYLGFQAKEVG
jgi:hypothetical protein